MSAGNVLRRLSSALKNSQQFEDSPLNIVPITDDSVVKFGNGTINYDVWMYGNTATDYMLWDASAGTLSAQGAAVVDVPDGQLQLSSTAVTATAAEINKACDVSGRIVNTTATTLTITATEHGGRIVKVSSTTPIAITLPAASGSGEVYTFVVNVSATATGHTIKVANTSDIISGISIIAQTDTAQVNGFLTTATDDTITVNGTTKGGIKGDKIVLIDMATNTYQCTMQCGASGTVVTPFSATV